MATNSPFHEPTDFGTWDLATSQTDKEMVFDFTSEDNPGGTVVSPNAKVVSIHNGRVIKTYTVGAGIELSSADKIATLSLSGTDYVLYEGRTVTCQASFITEGDVELIFGIEIKKSYL